MNSFNLPDKDRTVLKVDTPDIAVAGISDVGCLRRINEDHIWAHDSGKVLLLADGMGGHDRGADASRLALETLSDLLSPEIIDRQKEDITIPDGISTEIAPVYSIINRAVKKAATVMVEQNRELNLLKYMGTTIAGIILAENNHVCSL